jgi:hypothetical protein
MKRKTSGLATPKCPAAKMQIPLADFLPPKHWQNAKLK